MPQIYGDKLEVSKPIHCIKWKNMWFEWKWRADISHVNGLSFSTSFHECIHQSQTRACACDCNFWLRTNERNWSIHLKLEFCCHYHDVHRILFMSLLSIAVSHCLWLCANDSKRATRIVNYGFYFGQCTRIAFDWHAVSDDGKLVQFCLNHSNGICEFN